MFAKQSTARTFIVGPVLDADGVAVTDCVIGDFKVSKNGGAPGALDGSATLTHRNTGHYSLAATANDLDTLGTAQFVIDDTVNACQPVAFQVVPANVFDSLVGGTDTLQADVTQLGGDAQSATDLKDFADGGYDPSTNKVQGVVLVDTLTTYTGNTPQTGDAYSYLTTNLGLLGANLSAIPKTGFKLASDGLAAVTAWTVAITGNITGNLSGSVGSLTTNNDKTGYALSSSGVQAIWDALTSALTTVGSIGKLLVDNINATISSRLASASYTAPLDAAGTRSAVGLASANLDAQLDALPTAVENRQEMDANSTQLAAIVADTNELQTDWANGGRLDLLIDAIKAQTDLLPAAPAATGDIPTVSQIWTTALTEAYRATGATGTAAQLLYEILGHLVNSSNSGTTKTVKKLDKATTAKTYTYDDATNPTSIEETT